MKKYKYGDCIPESIKVYNRLKRKGYNPLMIEGWVEVDIEELLPDRDFLFYFYPEQLKRVKKDLDYNDYIRVFQHTWVEVEGHKIDITKSQFDLYGGIVRYYVHCRYDFKGDKEIICKNALDKMVKV